MTETIILERVAREIADVARALGLNFYPVNFEICPPEAIYAFGAYGMPVRFTHWSFGKAFYRLKTQYDLNLSRIYELVINANPAYAFLLEGNSLVQNKLVIAHVYAHVDFFKNNYYFARTPKDMIERMAAHAQRIRDYEISHGREKVEKTLDAVLAIQEHVDPRAHIGAPKHTERSSLKESSRQRAAIDLPYSDLWPEEEIPVQPKEEGSDDLLNFLVKHAPGLEEWQRDIISMVREESLYFYPQIETKIINEGWATFWHRRIMHELNLSPAEAVEFALIHSQVVQPSSFSLNPYYIGTKIWEYLEQHRSMDELFEIREAENDVSFVRNYLNQELIEELNLFNYQKIGSHWQVTETDWQKVRDNLVMSLYHGGYPRIIALDDDYEGRGTLYLKHAHEGIDLDVFYLEKTLALVQSLWGKQVILETILDKKKVIFDCSHGQVARKYIMRV